QRDERRPRHIDVVSKKWQRTALEHGQIWRIDLQLLNLRTSRQRPVGIIRDLNRRKECWRITRRGLRGAHIESLPARVRREGWFGILNISTENREVRRPAVVFESVGKFAGDSEGGVNCEQIVIAQVVPRHCELACRKRHAGHKLMSAAGPVINDEWSRSEEH